MKNIAIFASGEGTNAQKIIDYFKDIAEINVSLIASNKQEAVVLERARKNEIANLILDKQTFFETNKVVIQLLERKIDLIILAGFLWIIPPHLIKAFPNKIINIHPALLPKFGGKGMYGMKVHQAVIKNNEKESGITVHYVNEYYDQGIIILQEKCAVDEQDSPKDLSDKIQALEYEYYPKVIEKLLKEM